MNNTNDSCCVANEGFAQFDPFAPASTNTNHSTQHHNANESPLHLTASTSNTSQLLHINNDLPLSTETGS